MRFRLELVFASSFLLSVSLLSASFLGTSFFAPSTALAQSPGEPSSSSREGSADQVPSEILSEMSEQQIQDVFSVDSRDEVLALANAPRAKRIPIDPSNVKKFKGTSRTKLSYVDTSNINLGVSQETLAKAATEKIENQVRATKAMGELTEVKKCASSSTERERFELPVGVKQDGEGEMYDMLFLHKSQASLQELNFGEETLTSVYDESRPSMEMYPVKILRFHCLPARVRATENFRFVHYGDHALANYDSDPEGMGAPLRIEGEES